MKKHGIMLEYLFLAIVILGPLLAHGYVLTFDMSWLPHLNAIYTSNNTFPFYGLLHILNLIIPSWIIQKIMLLGIFVLAGVGAHRLAERMISKPAWAAYFAGMFFMVNPFVYTRLMAGQFIVLISYALMPWFIRAIARLAESPSWRRALALLGWSLAIGYTSIHSIGFMIVIGIIASVIYGRKAFAWLVGTGIAWTILNLFWLIPMIKGTNERSTQIAGFGMSQLRAFATTGDPVVGVPLNVLGLFGFWGDTQGRYSLIKYGNGWLVLLAIILVLVGVGVMQVWKTKRKLGIVLVATAFVAFIVGMGIAWQPVAGLNTFLVNHVPLWRGYREPEKWVGLIALAYSVFGAVGLAAVARRRSIFKYGAIGFALILPFIYTPTMLWAAGGQLKSVDYPKDWYALEQKLEAEPGQGKVLALPWHQYIELNFAGRNVANPAPGFFTAREVVSSNNFELKGVNNNVRSAAQSEYEVQVVPDRRVRTDAGSKLAKVGIEYVVLFKTADWEQYDWVSKQTDLHLVQDNQSLQVYKVTEYKEPK